jgi:pilus assembly protein Flp/PilA
MTRAFRALLKSEDGATAIEYALIAGLLSVVIIGAAQAVGTNLIVVFDDVHNGFQATP